MSGLAGSAEDAGFYSEGERKLSEVLGWRMMGPDTCLGVMGKGKGVGKGGLSVRVRAFAVVLRP